MDRLRLCGFRLEAHRPLLCPALPYPALPCLSGLALRLLQVALLTGGRVKIGYFVGLKLLRAGATLVRSSGHRRRCCRSPTPLFCLSHASSFSSLHPYRVPPPPPSLLVRPAASKYITISMSLSISFFSLSVSVCRIVFIPRIHRIGYKYSCLYLCRKKLLCIFFV